MATLTRMTSGFGLLFALAWLACGPGESPPAPPAPPAPAPRAAPPPAAPPSQPPSVTLPSQPPPVAQTASPDPARGDALYQQYCASCHGARGAGDGPVGQALDPKPAKHDDGSYMNSRSNAYLFQVIQEGGAAVGKSPLMAPWGGSLTDAQIWDVVAFLRTLAQPPYTGPSPP